MGRSPRDRGKVGSLIGAPPAPTGFTFYWAQFNVMLELGSDFQELFFTTPKDLLFKVKLAARELDTVSVLEDMV